MTGELEPITAFVHYKEEFSQEEIFQVMKKIEAERKIFNKNIEYKPLLVIKPNGIARKDEILSFLDSFGVKIKSQIEIPDWNDIALRLYSSPVSEWRVYRGLLLKEVLPGIEGTGKGELLLLENNYSFDELKELKLKVRSKLPAMHCMIHNDDDMIITTLGYLHSPDENSYWIEANLLF